MPRHKNPDEARTCRIAVAIRRKDFEELRAEAQAGLTSVSVVANRRIRGMRPTTILDQEGVRQLSGAANNLNQLTRRVNEGQKSSLGEDDLADLRRTIESLRMHLLGDLK